MEVNASGPQPFSPSRLPRWRFILRLINRMQLLSGSWRSWKLMSVFSAVLRGRARRQSELPRQLPLKLQPNLWQMADSTSVWSQYPLDISQSLHFNINEDAFLPLRPRTSTSLSVWGQASSPGAGGLYLHHSCSHVAEEGHSRHRLISARMKPQTKTIKYMIKKPVFIIDPQRKLLWKERAECQKQLWRPETHPTTWRKQIGWDLPLRINKPFSLELQIRRKGERQWPAWVYRVRI